MNRRSFLDRLAKAALGFSILPPATTYSRVWRVERPPVHLVAYWDQSLCATRCYDDSYVEFVESNMGIYSQLEKCGKVVERIDPTAMETAFWETLFLNLPIPDKLFPS
jgi:hypothetical protein